LVTIEKEELVSSLLSGQSPNNKNKEEITNGVVLMLKKSSKPTALSKSCYK
jgi:hypothetical protein